MADDDAVVLDDLLIFLYTNDWFLNLCFFHINSSVADNFVLGAFRKNNIGTRHKSQCANA